MLNVLMENGFWLQILRFAVGSSFLLGSAWCLIHFKLVTHTKLQSQLWKIAVTGSLLLLIPFNNPISPSFALTQTAPWSEMVADATTSESGLPTSPMFTAASRASQTSMATPATNWWPQNFSRLLFLVWFAGSLFALLRMSYSHRRAVAALGQRQAVEVDSDLYKQFKRCCHELEIYPNPSLTVSATTASPVTLPNGEICLPQWMLESFSEQELQSALAHELGHIRNNDLFTLIMMEVAVCVFFFQPLLRLARNRLVDLAEVEADREAVQLNNDFEQMANVLMNCAARVHQHRSAGLVFSMVGNTSNLRYRVEQLLENRSIESPDMRVSVRVLVYLAVLSVFALLPTFHGNNPAYATGAVSTKLVSCNVSSYRGLLDQVHRGRISAVQGLQQWEQSCGSESGINIDDSWKAFDLSDHHLAYMAQQDGAGEKQNSVLSALMYRAYQAFQEVSNDDQQAHADIP